MIFGVVAVFLKERESGDFLKGSRKDGMGVNVIVRYDIVRTSIFYILKPLMKKGNL